MKFEIFSLYYDEMKFFLSLEIYARSVKATGIEKIEGIKSVAALWSVVHSDIATLRKNAGLSQEIFAARYNIPTKTLEDWEAYKEEPAPYIVKLIAYTIYIDSLNADKGK